MPSGVTVVDGDLLEQLDVDAIVNAWNRNLFPATRFTISGVSRAILLRAGPDPFRELRRNGPMPVGDAVVTDAGRLPVRAIIHVAGINHRHRSSPAAVRRCVTSAVAAARRHGLTSAAFPLLGAGNGRLDPQVVLDVMSDALADIDNGIDCRIVRYRR